jgi:hypothetical protein
MAPAPNPPRRHSSPTPIEVTRAEGFRQLDQVQQAFARSERSQWAPPTLLGAWLAAGVFLVAPAHQRPLLLAGPLVLAGAAWLSSRLSPRAETTPSTRWAALAFIGVVGASLLRELHRVSWYAPALSRSATLGVAAVVLCLLAFSVFRLEQRGPELSPVIIAMITAREAMREPVDPDLWFWGALGVFLVALGTFRLARLLAFRWRLAALRRELGMGRG